MKHLQTLRVLSKYYCHMAHALRPVLARIYILKVSNRNTRKRCEICLKLIVNFEHISQLFLVFLVLFELVFMATENVQISGEHLNVNTEKRGSENQIHTSNMYSQELRIVLTFCILHINKWLKLIGF